MIDQQYNFFVVFILKRGMMNLRILVYASTSGKSSVKDFIERLPIREKANVYAAFEKITEYGLSVVQTRQIEGKVWELKTFRFNRFFYFIQEEDSILIFYATKKQKNKLEKKHKAAILDLYRKIIQP